MCSIGGVFSKSGADVYPLLLDLIFSQKHRGSEGFGISVGSQTVRSKNIGGLQADFLHGYAGICHSLLSITGHALQPLCSSDKKMCLVHNGQIYNFEELAGSGVASDSESIVRFLGQDAEKNVLPFMKKAVGNFAVGLLENNSLAAFRDPVGIKPLWFGENTQVFAFASEQLALRKLNINFARPLLPGHLLKISQKGLAEKKVFDLQDFKKTIPKTSDMGQLLGAFLRSIEFRTRGLKECGVFFSGGVDSSLIAKAVSGRVEKTVLFTAGLAGSEDVSFSDCVASNLGLRLVVSEISKDELPFLCLKVVGALGFFDLMQLGIALPLFVCAGEAKKSGLKVVFSGQGSDEVFCGYSSYQRAFSDGGPRAVSGLLWDSLFEMWSRNLLREDLVSMHFSLEHRLPFLDLGFLREAMALPVGEKILSGQDDLRKHAVRKLALKLGVPKIAIERRKKAVQYGSGVQKELAKIF